MKILAEISVGELYDKITILNIKLKKINDPNKLKNINNENFDAVAWYRQSYETSNSNSFSISQEKKGFVKKEKPVIPVIPMNPKEKTRIWLPVGPQENITSSNSNKSQGEKSNWFPAEPPGSSIFNNSSKSQGENQSLVPS